jgi:TPR repeat protein
VPNSPRSPQKSFAWFGEAARGGHARAAYFLTLSYQNGAGTDPSGEKAFQWYRRSAIGGGGEAMNALARMYAEGDGVRLNLSNAYAWNEVAGARGYDLAPQYRAQLEEKMSQEELAIGEKLTRRLMKKYAGGPD